MPEVLTAALSGSDVVWESTLEKFLPRILEVALGTPTTGLCLGCSGGKCAEILPRRKRILTFLARVGFNPVAVRAAGLGYSEIWCAEVLPHRKDESHLSRPGWLQRGCGWGR